MPTRAKKNRHHRQNISCVFRENANSCAMQRRTRAISRAAGKPAKPALKRQAEVFKALGHPGRMAIVHALGDGAVCACELATVAGCAASTASRHLTVLRHAGLIADERRGQQIFYRLTCPCVLTFAECINRVDAGEDVQTLRVACCA
jgi:ArsR family transcriptional regulator